MIAGCIDLILTGAAETTGHTFMILAHYTCDMCHADRCACCWPCTLICPCVQAVADLAEQLEVGEHVV